VRRGIRTGLRLALGLAGVATIMIGVSAIGGPRGQVLGWWLLAVVFYGVFGALGGALFGLLRPLARWYLGRVLIAYLLLLLVYGGGSVALYPLIAMRPDPPPLMGLLIIGALLCVVLAPLYAATPKSGALARFWDAAGE
jgi:hypothetical protein